jgi:hypothetical protein
MDRNFPSNFFPIELFSPRLLLHKSMFQSISEFSIKSCLILHKSKLQSIFEESQQISNQIFNFPTRKRPLKVRIEFSKHIYIGVFYTSHNHRWKVKKNLCRGLSSTLSLKLNYMPYIL